MKLDNDKVFKAEVLTIKQFAERSGNVSSSAIYYAIANELIDYIRLGDRTYIVLTKRTRQYKPNASPNRISKPTKSKRNTTK